MTDDVGGGERPRWEPSPDLLPGVGPVDDPTVAQDATVVDVGGERPPRPEAPADDPVAAARPSHVIPAHPDPTPVPPSAPPWGPPEEPYGPPDGEDDARSERNRRLVVAAVALALVAAVVVTAAVVRRDGGDGGTSTSTTAAATTSTTVPSGTRELVAGVRAIIPDGALTGGAQLEGEVVDLPDGLGALVAAGPVIELRVDGGRMLAPIALEFDLSGPAIAPRGGRPVVAGLYSAGSTPTFPGGELGADDQTFTFEVDAPGIAGAVTWDWALFEEAARTAFTDLADGTAPTVPDLRCADDLDDGELVTSGSGDAVRWCAEQDDDDRVVYAGNTSAFPVTIAWTGPVEALRNAGTAPAVDLGAALDGWSTGSSVTLGPGEVAMFTSPSGDDVTLTAEFDATAKSATALLGDVAFVAAFHELVPRADGTGSAQGVFDRIDPGCATGGGRAGALLAACFPEPTLASIVGGPAATLAAPLTDSEVLGRLLDEAASSAEPSMVRRADTGVALRGVAVPSWPVDDDADSDDLQAWLDDEGLVEDWSRCVEDLCVVGADGAVAVVRFDGSDVVDHEVVSLEAPDPYRALVDIGVPGDLAEQLVDHP